MNGKIPVFFLLLAVSVCVRAEDFPPAGVVFDFSLSSSSIRPGEPVSVIVKLHKQGDILDACQANFFDRPAWNCDVKMELCDEQMNTCGKARPWIVDPSRQNFSNYVNFDSGCFDLPVHMRLSTDMPTGKYQVRCSVTSLQIRGKRADGTQLPKMTGTITSPLLALEIRTADTQATRKVYDELLAESLKAQAAYDSTHAGTLGDWMDYVPELRRLMWAWGSAAVPVQLRAIHNGRMFPFNSSFTFFAYQNILEHPSVEAVEKLVALAKNGSFVQSTWWSGSYDPNLVWVLDELCKGGEQRFVGVIEPVLARFKTPVDIHLLEEDLPD